MYIKNCYSDLDQKLQVTDQMTIMSNKNYIPDLPVHVFLPALWNSLSFVWRPDFL